LRVSKIKSERFGDTGQELNQPHHQQSNKYNTTTINFTVMPTANLAPISRRSNGAVKGTNDNTILLFITLASAGPKHYSHFRVLVFFSFLTQN